MLSHRPVPNDLTHICSLAFEFGDGAARAADTYRLLPTGGIDLVYRFDRAAPEQGGDLILASVTSGPRVIPIPHPIGYVGVRLQPYAAPLLFDRPPAELLDRRLDLRQLQGGFADLAERLCSVADPVRMLAMMFEGLRGIAVARRRPLPRPRLRTVIDACAAGQVPAHLPELYKLAGCGERTFRRHCLGWVGLSPKTLLRIGRCVGVTDRIVHSDLPLAELAIAYHFSDQSHLTRELKSLHGVTPAALRRMSAVNHPRESAIAGV